MVNKLKYKYFINFLVVLIVMRVYLYGWITDDAFITFRSVLNFINGDGLVFNIGERVQSFTHPLWFLILSIFAYFDTNLYFLSITLGIFFTTVMLVYLKKFFEVTNLNNNILIIILILLFNSDIFLQFATSGLENSLTNLLLIMSFYYLLINYDDINNGKSLNIFIISIIISLLLLNRLDQLFIVIPLISYLFYKNYKFFLLGMLPIISWHIFSLVYYGFLFPNTKYAKIGGRSLAQSLDKGFKYFIDSLQSDLLFFSFFFFLFSIGIYTLISSYQKISNKNKSLMLFIIIGILLQFIYIIAFAGGDFMRGRFFISILILSMLLGAFLNFGNIRSGYILFIILISFISYYIGFNEKFIFNFHNTTNERNYYKKYLALNLNPYYNYTQHPWGVSGQNFNKNDKSVPIIGVNGQRGYWIDKAKLIDLVGLTDAFIARTPVINSNRTGHFEHNIPQEYLRLLRGEQVDSWENKDDEELYKNLTTIISGEIFSSQRVKSMIYIWKKYGI